MIGRLTLIFILFTGVILAMISARDNFEQEKRNRYYNENYKELKRDIK